jgi:hypothetical protein
MPNLIPIYRHYAPNPDRWCLTPHFHQGWDWSDGDLAFYVCDQQEPETTKIYEHVAEDAINGQGPYRYIYDDNPNNHDGWSVTGNVFYAYKRDNPRRPRTTAAIYQHREPSGGVDRYYYDTNPDPSGTLAFHAYPPKLLDKIAGVIGLRDKTHRGITYGVTSDNTFTLLDTPQFRNKGATAPNPIPACETLLREIANTISQARIFVDIAMMWEVNAGLPTGPFLQALNAGFSHLVHSGRLPMVRIMVGIPIGPVVRTADLKHWIETVITLRYPRKTPLTLDQVKFRILVGACKQKPLSWNHSKIVAADGERAIVGGHNLWSAHYIGQNPVNDVSGLIEGSAVAAAHRFCDQLWTRPALIPGEYLLSGGRWQKFSGKTTYPSGTSATPGKGTTRMLALGRLGSGIAKRFTVATNASVSARIIAMCHARKNIRISQQSLFNTVKGFTTGLDFYTLWAIIKAVRARVKVDIVITNDVPLSEGGYEGFLEKVCNSLASAFLCGCHCSVEDGLMPGTR